MKKWLQKIGDKLQGWMQGRYGYDELSKALTITAIVCILLAMFIPLLNTVGLILLIWSMFRTYSKNLEKRRAERAQYLKLAGGIKRWFKVRKDMWTDRKTHRYFKCPSCKTYLRVPKGKGNLEISCPKCHNKLSRKT